MLKKHTNLNLRIQDFLAARMFPVNVIEMQNLDIYGIGKDASVQVFLTARTERYILLKWRRSVKTKIEMHY